MTLLSYFLRNVWRDYAASFIIIIYFQTRIVVCNQPQYLRHMDKIILVHEGKLAVYDNLSDLQKDPKSPKTLFQTHDSSLERNAEIR